MYSYSYRRNADDSIREIERQFFSGDITALPELVAHKIRTNTFTVQFFIEHPVSFHYLPVDMQQALQHMGINIPPLPQELAQEDLCEACAVPGHNVCPLVPDCSCCADTSAQSGLPIRSEDQCNSCGSELVDCENIVDAEGNECGIETCSVCSSCIQCDQALCTTCRVTPQQLEARTGPHRCPETAECCANCGHDLFMQDQGEAWVFIGPEASDYLIEEHDYSADTGSIICQECLEQAGYDNIADATPGGDVPE